MEIFVIALDQVYSLGMAEYFIQQTIKALAFMESQKKLYAKM